MDPQEPPQNNVRAVLDLIASLTRLQVALSAGAVVLSVTFLDDLYKGQALHFLLAAWSSLGLSLLLGFFALGEAIRYLIEGRRQIKRGSSIEVLNLFQWLLFAVGVGLLAYFAVQNVVLAEGIVYSKATVDSS